MYIICMYCEFIPLTVSGWPGGRKVLSDSQKQSIIFWSTWNCTQCQAYVEENVGWARHELPEGGGEVSVWLRAMIIDHGTDFFLGISIELHIKVLFSYQTGYAMNFSSLVGQNWLDFLHSNWADKNWAWL